MQRKEGEDALDNEEDLENIAERGNQPGGNLPINGLNLGAHFERRFDQLRDAFNPPPPVPNFDFPKPMAPDDGDEDGESLSWR